MGGPIRVGDPEIEVTVRRHDRARRMVLRVSRHGRVPTLTVPPYVTVAEARAFVADQEVWLRRRIAEAPQHRSVAEGTLLPFRGGTLTVCIDPVGRIGIEGGTLHVPGPSKSVARQVAATLREVARLRCVEAAMQHAKRADRRVGRITMRDTRSRWGSCTSSGHLMFSWRLILAPDAVLDYVVAHEIAHLVELNHSPAFWGVVRTLCPAHEAARTWLRQQGRSLLAFDFSGSI
jgi:predicted metal-dependent hydrolase